MRITLRGWFVLVFVTFSLVVTAAVGFVSWWIARGALEQELDTRLRQVAGAAAETGLQSSLVLALEPGDEYLSAWTSTHQRLARLHSYVDAAYIIDPAGRALVTHAPPDSIPIGTLLRFLEPHREEMTRARTIGFATTDAFDYDDRQYKYAFMQLKQSPAVPAVLMPADFMRPVGRLGRTLLLGSMFAALLAAGLGTLLAGGVIEPLERLSRSARLMERGQMSQPVAPEEGLEVGQLARAMERMRGALVQRDEQLRLMVAQVAHEIRNPLGGLELFAAVAVVSVLDDGPGVAPQNRSRIFEPFVTDKERGAELGLAIVKKVVDGMGCRIEVGEARRPGFGKGACFRLYFPGSEDLPATVRQPEPRPEPSPVSV